MTHQLANAKPERFRQALITAITIRVTNAMAEIISTLPPEVSSEVRELIREDLGSNSIFQLNRMSFESLQDETAVDKHVAMVRRSANHLVFRLSEQWKRE
jgi:hypothetical protein